MSTRSSTTWLFGVEGEYGPQELIDSQASVNFAAGFTSGNMSKEFLVSRERVLVLPLLDLSSPISFASWL